MTRAGEIAESIASVEDLGSIIVPMSEDLQSFVTTESGISTPPSGL